MRAKKQFGNEFDANRHLKETPRMTSRTLPQRSTSNMVLYVVLTIVFLIIGAMVISGFKDDALVLQQKMYCQQVARFNANPDIGWPDYEHSFEASCNADGTVKVQP